MRVIYSCLLLAVGPVSLLPCVLFSGQTHPPVEVVDGDTIHVRFPELPLPLGPTLKVRLRHVDAPELYRTFFSAEGTTEKKGRNRFIPRATRKNSWPLNMMGLPCVMIS